MLIIFDLDDTLIDTSGAITPFKLRCCLERMVDMGLKVIDMEGAYKDLLKRNSQAKGSMLAIQGFLKAYGGDLTHLEQLNLEMTRPLPDDFLIPTTPNAKTILEFFSKKCPLALVTGGYRPFQLQKLEKAGIDKSIFSKIGVPEDSIKKPFYEGIIQEFSVPAHEVWVCGDRIQVDLAPAHELGCKTVHMRWGRGNRVETEKWVDHAISDLRELKRIVNI